jgi:PAS domain S-box-containing protein
VSAAADPAVEPDAFLGATGEMSRLIAAYDWSDTLGPISGWPQSLKAAVGLVVHSPVPMVLLWGEDGIMIYNDAYSVFAGGRHPRLLGSKVREGWPEVASFNDNVMKVGLAGGTLFYEDQELTLYRAGFPERVWMNLAYSPIMGDDGQPGGVIAVVLETTARVRSETTLRESEARLRFLDSLGKETARSRDADAILATTTRMVGEHLGVSICAYADMDEDQDGFTIRGDWSAPGSATIVGHYSLADFGKLAVRNLGAGLPLIVNDNLAELAPEEAATFQAIGISATICMPLVKEGRLTALMAIHDKAPRQWSTNELATIREVTERSWAHIERIRAEAELRASEETFRTLARAMPHHVWTAPASGQLDWFNDQVYAYAGVERGALDGEGWATIVHPDDLADTVARWSSAVANGAPYETEFRLLGADGQYRWHIGRAVPVTSEVGQITRWIGTNTDIQDQREIADALIDVNTTLEHRVEERTRQLLQAEEALRHAQKMEAVGQLTGGIAHDFNNLLAGISGSLELLERRLAEGALKDVERYIAAAQKGSRRAAALTQRLLAFSRRQTLDPKPIDLNRMIAGMEELIRRSVGPDIEVQVLGQEPLWTTRLDPSQVENTLLNLCINARDAMAPAGGRLTIDTANRALDAAAAAERELEPGDYVCLCVSDTGAGMTPEVLARAFDPFFTTKPLGEGTGLGLSMVYGFVRQSGGQVRIASHVGEGTTVHVYFPRHQGPAEAESDAAMAGGEAARTGDGEMVLVVDDEPIVRMLIVDVLEEGGYGAVEAADGPAALKILQSDLRIDLLVTDVGLPGGMNGRQVADAARALRPGLKVLFVTGYAENAVVGDGRLEEGMEVITKPFATAALAQKIRETIDR